MPPGALLGVAGPPGWADGLEAAVVGVDGPAGVLPDTGGADGRSTVTGPVATGRAGAVEPAPADAPDPGPAPEVAAAASRAAVPDDPAVAAAAWLAAAWLGAAGLEVAALRAAVTDDAAVTAAGLDAVVLDAVVLDAAVLDAADREAAGVDDAAGLDGVTDGAGRLGAAGDVDRRTSEVEIADVDVGLTVDEVRDIGASTDETAEPRITAGREGAAVVAAGRIRDDDQRGPIPGSAT